MASYLTSSTLIDTIKREAMLPTNQSTFTNADFLAFANQEMKIGVVPSVLSYHQEYFVRDSDPITIVSGKSNYTVPYRAMGGKFRELFYQDTNGNLRGMSRISPDDRPYYQQSSFENNFIYFFIEGNDVVLVPPVSEAAVGSLVFSYFLRPNELVDESRVATISNIAMDTLAGTTTYTVDQIPTGFSTNVDLDLLQTRPGHATYNYDIRCTSIDSTNLTMTFLTSVVSSQAIVGDYVAFAGEAIIPQIPTDLHDYLAQRVAARCLQSLGDTNGLAAASVKLAEMEIKTGNLIDNRSEGQPQKVNNLKGLLRTGRRHRRGWY